VLCHLQQDQKHSVGSTCTARDIVGETARSDGEMSAVQLRPKKAEYWGGGQCVGRETRLTGETGRDAILIDPALCSDRHRCRRAGVDSLLKS
jgi:hypothetical protein